MMKKTLYLILVVIFVVTYNIEAKKLSRSRSSGSSRGSSRKTNSNPAPNPTSFSYPQASAPKPSLFGWQEKPAQTSSSRQSHTNNGGHSYPSSHTGLSGNNQPKQQATHQESMQRANIPSQQTVPVQKNNQPVHSYPSSNSLSGNSGTGSGAAYPQGTGLSGSGGAYPQGTGLSGSNAAAPPPYQGINSANNYKPQGNYPQGSGLSGSNGGPPPYQSNYPANSFSNTHQHPHGAPPPYSSSGNNHYNHPQGPPPPYFGHGNGGYGQGGYNQQSPGYFGNYANTGRNFGGVSRTGSALTGVGIAGAGIGTVLTGLALWNLARSTGHHHHTVVYDNRGQPIAVAPENGTAPAVDPILGDLVNCTLTISSDNATEVIGIPCSIATSFSPDATVKDSSINKNGDDNTKCTVTVVNSAGKEFMTTIPCSVLLNTAAQNNVTEPAIIDNPPINTPILDNPAINPPILDNPPINKNETVAATDEKLLADQPSALQLSNLDDNQGKPEANLNCSQELGDVRDPINPCFSVKHNLTVIPLDENEKHDN